MIGICCMVALLGLGVREVLMHLGRRDWLVLAAISIRLQPRVACGLGQSQAVLRAAWPWWDSHPYTLAGQHRVLLILNASMLLTLFPV